MSSESSFKATIAGAGLLITVALTWALLFALGDLGSDGLLAGFLAAGLGILIVSLVDRVSGRFFAASPEEEHEAEVASPAYVAAEEPERPDEETAVAPRLRVLLISAGLEALAVAFFAGYYSGSVVISVAAGVIACTLAVGVSFLLARKLTPA